MLFVQERERQRGKEGSTIYVYSSIFVGRATSSDGRGVGMNGGVSLGRSLVESSSSSSSSDSTSSIGVCFKRYRISNRHICALFSLAVCSEVMFQITQLCPAYMYATIRAA